MQGEDVTGAVRPGERFGRFTVLAELAAGGMGRVYLARTDGGRTVALKTLLTDSEDDRRRFAREVALAQRVRGVYTASIVAADPAAAVPWMAQEYVPAPSLKELLDGCGTLGPDALHWIAAGIAEALASLHEAGLVHRDVKPANVLLPIEGPRLIDFGISQAHDVTRTQTALGTVAFAAPEQARGEPTTGASDVFSLGATLFCLATGRPPYARIETASAMELLVRAARGETDVTGLPEEVAGLVLPCLAPDPADRPTPAAVVALCARRLSGRPSSARGGEDWIGPRWAEAVERHRARRIEALEAAGRRFGPDATTSRVPAPPATSRLDGPADGAPGAGGAGAGGRGGPRSARNGRLPRAVGALAVTVLAASVLVWRPWEGETRQEAGVPDTPVRFLEVAEEHLGVCPGTVEGTDGVLGAATEPPLPEGRGFVADDRSVCVEVSDAEGLTVDRFREVVARESQGTGLSGWEVAVTFEDADRAAWTALTSKVSGRPSPTDQLAVVQGEGRLLSNVMIKEPLTGGSAVIATRLGRNQARFLAEALGAP
ncbi:serine/threonine-protein kinase [Streptomyces sp. t39]|uniref:serine/threonine-protein kinase n=1 Tax=Streptomyces sp. t39 TaxID=1828156 RepID=UPI0011CEAA40|nr:serine/threonine-protein kinase [Streptomyces sp. t39]TXS56468.1 serine/threonine protein kinase [Streptomyces sp. t39]